MIEEEINVPDGYVNLLAECGSQPDLARLYLYRYMLMKRAEDGEVLNGTDLLVGFDPAFFLRMDVIRDQKNTSNSSIEFALVHAKEQTFWQLDFESLRVLLTGTEVPAKLYKAKGWENNLELKGEVKVEHSYEQDLFRSFINPSLDSESFCFFINDSDNSSKRISPRKIIIKDHEYFVFPKLSLNYIYTSQDYFERLKIYHCDQFFILQPKVITSKPYKEKRYKYKTASYTSNDRDAFSEVFKMLFSINDDKISNVFVVLLITVLYLFRKELEGVLSGSKPILSHKDSEEREEWVGRLVSGLNEINVFNGVRPEMIELEEWLLAKNDWERLLQSGLLDSLGWHFFARRFAEEDARTTGGKNIRLSMVETSDLTSNAFEAIYKLDTDLREVSLSDLLDKNSVFHRLLLGVERVSADVKADIERGVEIESSVESYLTDELEKEEYDLPQTTFVNKIVPPLVRIIYKWTEELRK